jgi:hypothetical protein
MFLISMDTMACVEPPSIDPEIDADGSVTGVDPFEADFAFSLTIRAYVGHADVVRGEYALRPLCDGAIAGCASSPGGPATANEVPAPLGLLVSTADDQKLSLLAFSKSSTLSGNATASDLSTSRVTSAASLSRARAVRRRSASQEIALRTAAAAQIAADRANFLAKLKNALIDIKPLRAKPLGTGRSGRSVVRAKALCLRQLPALAAQT